MERAEEFLRFQHFVKKSEQCYYYQDIIYASLFFCVTIMKGIYEMNVHSPINRFKQLNIRKILPGLLLAFLVAIASKLLALLVPQLGAATIAILLGILLGNTFFKQASLATGTKFAESKLLECSVFLLGATVTAQTIAQIGIKGILFVLLQMSVTIVGVYWIGKNYASVTLLL